jgi:thiosulfate reductase cytochrome b subunit
METDTVAGTERIGPAFRRNRWFALVWIVPTIIVGLFLLVLLAMVYRESPQGQAFLDSYPGAARLPAFAPTGFPAWLAWQHGLNAFFIVFIIRAGWMIRTTKRPDAYWTRSNSGLLRTSGTPVRISINLWMHICFDTLWVLNGVLFYVLIFCTGQWTRIVPTGWDVIPNAFSALVQYVSLDWPTSNGWANYNALQLLSYFVIVFVAAPLAVITGIRTAPGFARRFSRFDRVFPTSTARKLHFPIAVFFFVFVIVHVTLVLATGATRNLNHMYAGNDGTGWAGFWVFVGSLVLMAAVWVSLRPSIQRALAGLSGKVGR